MGGGAYNGPPRKAQGDTPFETGLLTEEGDTYDPVYYDYANKRWNAKLWNARHRVFNTWLYVGQQTESPSRDKADFVDAHGRHHVVKFRGICYHILVTEDPPPP